MFAWRCISFSISKTKTVHISKNKLMYMQEKYLLFSLKKRWQQNYIFFVYSVFFGHLEQNKKVRKCLLSPLFSFYSRKMKYIILYCMRRAYSSHDHFYFSFIKKYTDLLFVFSIKYKYEFNWKRIIKNILLGWLIILDIRDTWCLPSLLPSKW